METNNQFVLQEDDADEKKTNLLYQNSRPSFSRNGKEPDTDANDEFKIDAIPMVEFTASKQEEYVSAATNEDECNEDCELFNPADLMKFAWQIARGVVSKHPETLFNLG